MKQSRRRIGATKLPCLMFTLDELLLLKKSLVLLKQLLVTNRETLPNREFAHETIMNLQRKLYQIRLCWRMRLEYTFSEKWVIQRRSSLQL